MIEADRFITPIASPQEEVQDRAIRPKALADYQGQRLWTNKWRFLLKRQKGALKP